MRIRVILNPGMEDFGAIESQLKSELGSIPLSGGGKFVAEAGPPPERTLPLDQVTQFIIEHVEDIKALVPLATAALQVTVEVLRRRGVRPPPKPRQPQEKKPKAKSKQGKRKKATKKERALPPAIFMVGDRMLFLPTSPEKQRRFVTGLSQAEEKGPERRIKPTKKK